MNKLTRQSSRGIGENNGLKVSASRLNYIPALIVVSLLPSNVTKCFTFPESYLPISNLEIIVGLGQV